ncbi:hypothetical protein H6G97_41095 [Nostoc flagelliforme FACHB-838]|jgi:hypothetical protein|uniref:Transposase n=1 Tax=Nostoc flagelliforme FACHB-838 TaxID=2692904 RepID=A0ABR8E4I9_9NOSO|nr:hypothetical protein [Nostoc flagelliforme]MBD2535455.1 hypothetical protein [Nostoc flagelliforme FACHB-838]
MHHLSETGIIAQVKYCLARIGDSKALERESSFRRSIRQKSRRAAMNDQYMLSVLAASLPNSILY